MKESKVAEPSPRCPICGETDMVLIGRQNGDISVVCSDNQDHVPFEVDTVADFARFFAPKPAQAEAQVLSLERLTKIIWDSHDAWEKADKRQTLEAHADYAEWIATSIIHALQSNRQPGAAPNILETLASALKKFCPEAVELILKKSQESNAAYEEFMAFMRSEPASNRHPGFGIEVKQSPPHVLTDDGE